LDQRCSITVTIVNRLGLHARPAMSFVDTASQFQAAVTVRRGDQEVDGKSIMHMMMLAATKGTALEIVAEGADAEACCETLRKLVEGGFDEE
jgi:phosphocarrier protein HPr